MTTALIYGKKKNEIWRYEVTAQLWQYLLYLHEAQQNSKWAHFLKYWTVVLNSQSIMYRYIYVGTLHSVMILLHTDLLIKISHNLNIKGNMSNMYCIFYAQRVIYCTPRIYFSVALSPFWINDAQCALCIPAAGWKAIRRKLKSSNSSKAGEAVASQAKTKFNCENRVDDDNIW